MTLKMISERVRRQPQLQQKNPQRWGENQENENLKAFQCYRKCQERTSKNPEGQARGRRRGEEGEKE